MPTYETDMIIDDDDVEVVVHYEYEPPCGDGWHEPRFAEQVCIYSVVADGAEININAGQEDYLIDAILGDLDRQAAEYEADKAEYQYEAMKEAGLWH